ncbi:unnamed protein product [Peronospora destructor]|uniref:BZIP domain-containing protein n=1 Tax=Peronospora destructor TaxID=86335 RepID=A0AAV0VGM7_9STRA|nr:unnamed protein product [Peronospora destructor]
MEASMDVLELTALPPLSLTMERAFTEAFADMSELEDNNDDAAMIKLEPLWPASTKDLALSPTPVSVTSLLHNYQMHTSEIRNISPSEGKKQTSKDATEGKRARRSAIEKKSRQRRQNVLKTMRDEVSELEKLYSSAVDELQRKFSELTLIAHASEKEQETLQKLLQQYTKFQKTVTSLSEKDEEQRNQMWNTGVPPSLSFEASFTKLTTAECYALVRESYEEIQRFNNAEHFVSTGVNFMGWTDKRKYDPISGTLQYGFTKQFPLEDSENLLMKTWDIVTDAPKLKDISFDRSINFRYEVLQRMNDDLVIVRQDHRIPHIETTFATVQLVFRLETSTGYILCIRTIPSPEFQNMQEAHECFYNVFHSTHFNRMYDEFGNPAGCELISAGSIADQKQFKSTYWLFELVCSILRWENGCVGSLFLKQA